MSFFQPKLGLISKFFPSGAKAEGQSDSFGLLQEGISRLVPPSVEECYRLARLARLPRLPRISILARLARLALGDDKANVVSNTLYDALTGIALCNSHSMFVFLPNIPLAPMGALASRVCAR